MSFKVLRVAATAALGAGAVWLSTAAAAVVAQDEQTPSDSAPPAIHVPDATTAPEVEEEPALRPTEAVIPSLAAEQPEPLAEPSTSAQSIDLRFIGVEDQSDMLRTPSGGSGLDLSAEVGLRLFAEYRATFVDDGASDWYHELELTRGWAWLSIRVDDVVGRVLLEATRSGGAGSLVGVAGDSIVLRLREAWVGYRLWNLFELRAGLVPQLTTPSLTQLWRHRSVSRTGLRVFDLMQPADLGATLGFEIPEGWGWLRAGYYNGEGYRSRELNRGKTAEFAGLLHPLNFLPEARALTVMVAYQMGSTGAGAAREDRLVAALAWDDPRLSLGVDVAWLLGLEDRGDREGVLIDAWARVEPFDDVPMLLDAHLAHLVTDTQSEQTSSATVLTGAIGVRIESPLRVFAAFDAQLADAAYASSNPGFERWNLRLVVEGNLVGRIAGVL